MASSGKKSMITFQHIVIQLVRKNTRLLNLSLALDTFGQSWVISETACSYWLHFFATGVVATS